MEEVLDLYEEAYEPKRPMVCFDERPCQLLAEVTEPLPSEPGKVERSDYEYERRGIAYVFMTSLAPDRLASSASERAPSR